MSTPGTVEDETFGLTRPLARLSRADPTRSLAQAAASLHALADAVAILSLPPGARILDAGCGAGWVSHWLARLGYRTLGVDAAEEAVDLARTRIAGDPDLETEIDEIDEMFLAHDLGVDPLPDEAGRFAAVLFMDGLAGFADAETALAHAAAALEPEGVVLILGPPDRPRDALNAALDGASLVHRRYLGAVQGWYAGLLGGAEGCLAATSPEALARVAPPEPPDPEPEPEPPPLANVAPVAPTPPPPPRQPLLTRLWRALKA